MSFLLRKKPTLCNYYLTYRCNAKCGFCEIWERPSPYVTLENVTQNLIDLKKLGVKIIDFTGGEPLLHRELPLFLQKAKELGFITTVTTNTLLYPKYANQLKGLIDMLHFSLDSPIREEHNKSRGVECFDFILKSIEIAKQLGERPDIIFTVDENNIHQIEQVYNDFIIKNNLVLILNPMFSYKGVGTEISPEKLKELKKWSRRKLVYLNDAFIMLREDGGNHIENPVCRAGTTSIVISPENKLIMPCYHLEKDNFPIENNLLELRKSDKIQNLIKMEGKYAECEGCTINCYMQPSFAVEYSKYWRSALYSTLKYNLIKGTWKKML